MQLVERNVNNPLDYPRELFNLSDSEIDEVKRQVNAVGGLARVFVHPYYDLNCGRVVCPGKVSRGLERILTSSSPLTPPVIIFEEVDMVDETWRRLRPMLQKTEKKVFFIKTMQHSPIPIKPAFVRNNSFDARWEAIIEVLRRLGVKTVLIGGQRLSIHYFSYLSGCVGYTASVFSKSGIKVEISSLAEPDSRYGLIRFKNEERK